MKLNLDGKEIPIPPEPEGIIIINVLSYASGSDPWGQDEDYENSQQKFSKPSYTDKLLEVAFVLGPFHMCALSIDLTSAVRCGQAGTIEIEISDDIQIDSGLPFQVDGEPMLLESGGKVAIKYQHQVPVLKKYKKSNKKLKISISWSFAFSWKKSIKIIQHNKFNSLKLLKQKKFQGGIFYIYFLISREKFLEKYIPDVQLGFFLC